MQSMIPVKRNGQIVNAFFDVNWDAKRIENIRIRQEGEFLSMTDGDITALSDLIEQEVADILMDAALDKMQGKATIHA